jgi:hypothetical protein
VAVSVYYMVAPWKIALAVIAAFAVGVGIGLLW